MSNPYCATHDINDRPIRCEKCEKREAQEQMPAWLYLLWNLTLIVACATTSWLFGFIMGGVR